MSEQNVEKAPRLIDLVGTVAAREYENARETYRPELLAYAERLATLDDREFVSVAASAIHGSALVNSWRGNWEHEHFKASACYFESERRTQVRHAEGCTVSTLYERAYNQTVRSQGHHAMASDHRPCTCAASSSTPATPDAERPPEGEVG